MKRLTWIVIAILITAFWTLIGLSVFAQDTPPAGTKQATTAQDFIYKNADTVRLFKRIAASGLPAAYYEGATVKQLRDSLSKYYSKEKVDSILIADYYKKTAIDTKLGLKTDKTTTVNGHPLSSNVVVSKSDVGLGSVDNTSDAGKPISTATQTALNLKENLSNKATSLSSPNNTTYPTTQAVSTAITSGATPDATTSVKGKLKLAGDLSGTADLPTVPALADKVDKVSGKGLSTEDYTAAEKAKLAGIATGAEVNVQSDWNASTGDAAILNKPATASNLSIGTRTTTTVPVTNDNGTGTTLPSATTALAGVMPSSALVKLNGIATGATANQTDAYLLARSNHTGTQPISTVSGLQTELDGKVDKITGKGLSAEDYTTAEKTKLSGIATAATANATDAYLLSRSNHTGSQAISTVTNLQATLDAKIPLTQKAAANGVATLGSDGKVPNSQIPALAISETFVVASQSAMLAISGADQGDVAVRTDLSKSYILTQAPASTLGNWQELLTPVSAVQSVNGQVGVVNLSTSDISEGTNQYFTTSRARSSVSNGSGIGYNSSTGEITNSSPNQSSNLALGTRTTTTVPITNSDGTGVTLPASTTSLAGVMSSADKTKLDGIASGATANTGTVTNVSSANSNISVSSATTTPVLTLASTISSNTSGNAATASNVPWSGVTSKPSFATVATSGSYNDLSDKPTIPAAQTLSFGPNNGSLSISGGNTVTVTGMGNNTRNDANTGVPAGGMQPYVNSTGSTDYPSSTGGGFVYNRNGASNVTGQFEFWKANSSANNLYFRNGSGTSTFHDWDIVAGQSWVSSNFTNNTGTVTSITAGDHLTGGTINGSGTIGFAPAVNTWISDSGGNQRIYFGSSTGSDILLRLAQTGGRTGISDNTHTVVWAVNDTGTQTVGTVPWARLSGQPTTLSGYGITDAPTKTGTGASGNWGISITGNSATATKLATAITINGVSFDGSANITVADGTKEPSFSKNTAFNKNFGTASGTVAQGNDSRINNGQTAYGWGNHASAGYSTASNSQTFTNKTWNGADITDSYIASASTWNAKQAALVSGTNIKTINGQSILGSGNITVSEPEATGGTYTPTVTSTSNLSSTSVGTTTYTVVNGIVTVYGAVTVSATGTGTAYVKLHLPSTYSIGSDSDVNGIGHSLNGVMPFVIVHGDSSTSSATLTFSATIAGQASVIKYSYQYAYSTF